MYITMLLLCNISGTEEGATSFSVKDAILQASKCHRSLGCVSVMMTFWKSAALQPWAKTRYHFIIHHDKSKWIWNQEMASRQIDISLNCKNNADRLKVT